MEHEKFDRLAVALGRAGGRSTRRGALKAALGGAVAAVVGTTAAEAKKKKGKSNCKGYAKRCSRDNDCCSGNCINGFCFPGGGNGGGGGGGGGCRGWGQGCNKNSQCCSNVCVNGLCLSDGQYTCNNNNDCNDGYYCCRGVYGNYNQCVPYGSPCNGNGGGCGNCGAGFKCCTNGGVSYCVPNGTSCGGGGGGGGGCGSQFTRCNGPYGTMCCPKQGMRCCGNGRCCPNGFRCGGVGCMNVAATGARDGEEIADFTPAVTPEEARALAGDPAGGKKHRKRKHKK